MRAKLPRAPWKAPPVPAELRRSTGIGTRQDYRAWAVQADPWIRHVQVIANAKSEVRLRLTYPRWLPLKGRRVKRVQQAITWHKPLNIRLTVEVAR